MVRMRSLQIAPMIIMLGIICTWVIYENVFLVHNRYENGRTSFNVVDSELSKSYTIYRTENATLTEFNGVRAIIQMDKEVYFPGEAMKIRVVFVYAENGTLVPLRASRSITLKVVFPDKHEQPLPCISRFSGIVYSYYHTCFFIIFRYLTGSQRGRSLSVGSFSK